MAFDLISKTAMLYILQQWTFKGKYQRKTVVKNYRNITCKLIFKKNNWNSAWLKLQNIKFSVNGAKGRGPKRQKIPQSY